MTRQIGPNEILIEDIEPDLLLAIEARARISGRIVEEEAGVLLKEGWAQVQASAASKR